MRTRIHSPGSHLLFVTIRILTKYKINVYQSRDPIHALISFSRLPVEKELLFTSTGCLNPNTRNCESSPLKYFLRFATCMPHVRGLYTRVYK